MRENIVIQVGQCGNQTAHAFWRRISAEHSLVPQQNAYIRTESMSSEGRESFNRRLSHFQNNSTDTGKPIQERGFHHSDSWNPLSSRSANHNNRFSSDFYRTDALSTFFQETQNGCYIPRAVLCDLEPRVIQNLYPYSEKTTFVGTAGAGNNFAAGYYAKESQNVMDIIRMQVESCDNLASLILVHSVSGGTGSGMGSQLLELLRETLPKSFIKTLSVFPNAVGDIVVQPYNSVLCLQRLSTCADLCVIVDNLRANIVSQDVRVSDSLFNSTYNRFYGCNAGWDYGHNTGNKQILPKTWENRCVFSNQGVHDVLPSTNSEKRHEYTPNIEHGNQTKVNPENGKSEFHVENGSCRKEYRSDSFGEGYAGINGVIAGTLGMTTAVCRFPAPILPSIPALGAILCPIDQLKFVVPSFCIQRTNTMHALGKNLLASTQKGLSIACVSVLSNDNEVTQKEMLARNLKTTTWNPKTNLCVKTTNRGFSATQLHNHSGIAHLFEQTAEQFDALKRRNAFVEAYRAFSSDLAIFDEARDVCQQIIDAYKSV